MTSFLRRALPVTLVLIACNDDPGEPADPVTLVELSADSVGLSPGDTVHLSAAISGPRGRLFDRAVTWSSDDPSVATVTDSGIVTGTTTGTTFIRTESEGVKDSALLSITRPFQAVTAGDRAICALNTNGAAYCWGNGIVGQLGWAGASDTAGPVPVAGGHTFTQLASGGAHTCGINSSGDSYCWGSNFQGELDGGVPDPNEWSALPLATGNSAPFVGITASFNYSCGLDAAGVVYCWGYPCATDTSGMFFCWGSFPSVPMDSTPVLASISAGYSHMCGTTAGGAVYCWGSNGQGQIGVEGATGGSVPIQVTLPAAVRSIAAGNAHTCAVTVNDDGYCWGRNDERQLGTGNTTSSPTPVLVSGNHKWTTISAGDVETCGIALDGITYCWGHLGDGTSAPVPLAITGRDFQSVTVGNGTSCGVTAGNAAYCWGGGSYGQLGNGSRLNTIVPRRVLDP